MIVNCSEIAVILGISEKHIPMLVNSFFDESKIVMDKLHRAIAVLDFKHITLHAHSIKGSAGSLRFNEIAEIAKEIEKAGKESDSIFDFSSHYQKLKEAIDAIELPKKIVF